MLEWAWIGILLEYKLSMNYITATIVEMDNPLLHVNKFKIHCYV